MSHAQSSGLPICLLPLSHVAVFTPVRTADMYENVLGPRKKRVNCGEAQPSGVARFNFRNGTIG